MIKAHLNHHDHIRKKKNNNNNNNDNNDNNINNNTNDYNNNDIHQPSPPKTYEELYRERRQNRLNVRSDKMKQLFLSAI